MEFGHSGDVMKKRTSFGLSVADEKIKLIDILSEDDYFLVSSPFCDHSLQSSISELERMEQKEKNLFYGNSEESRPSFLRRSLAWDSAFDSSGVLDQEDFLFINNGASETSLLPANHEVRNRIYEPESTLNDAGLSADWFELQPSFIESMTSKSLNLNVVERKSSKSGLKPIVQSSRKGDMLCKNKMKTNPASIGKSINLESEGKMKKELSIRRASCNKNLSRISNLSMDNKSMKTSLALSSPVHKQRRSVDSKDVKEASNMRPSGLRPPSPCHRFFDESTPQQAERSRKLPQRNHRNPSSESAKSGASTIDNLCRSFEGFALNGGSWRTASTKPCRRTPLADRSSKCNFSGAFASPLMEPKKDKLVRRASSVRHV
ncbi:hypothetical protein SASPL_127421 [Salvia splendens]|uniref:Uncharacterized protein n=1 Tax=Salvia splendens TaxID=180675 RepID=A0A8X8ZL67_SALSN|nr:hypothetical protein SASPL_127421 [Salvia splendens]